MQIKVYKIIQKDVFKNKAYTITNNNMSEHVMILSGHRLGIAICTHNMQLLVVGVKHCP